MRILILTCVLAAAFPRVARADDPLYACHALAPTTKIHAQFSPEVDLKDLVAWVIGFSCKNVVLSADVLAHTPKIVVVSPQEMTPKQAIQLFVDAVESTGLVVTVKADTLQIKVGPNMPLRCDVVGSSPAPAPVFTDAELDAGVTKIDDTHAKVARALVTKLLATRIEKLDGVRIVPSERNGKPDGWKLYAIRPTSLLARVGFANGDTLEEVNGFPLIDAQKSLEVIAKVKDAKQLEFSLVRRGKPIKILVTVD